MSKVDCSKVLNYVAERKRMCDAYIAPCYECPLYSIGDCYKISLITQKHIDAVQKWSDEHPQPTMAEKFFEMFPNAKKTATNLPVVCPKFLGWPTEPHCPKLYGQQMTCADCWNRPYSEVTK